MKKKTFLILTAILLLAIIISCKKDNENTDATNGKITVLQPEAGVSWAVGSEEFITWSHNMSDEVHVELFKGGLFYQKIKYNSNTMYYQWTIPAELPSGNDYQIKVKSLNYTDINDFSDYFEIAGTPGGGGGGETPDFVAKWIVQNKSISTYVNETSNFRPEAIKLGSSNSISDKLADPNLKFFKPDDWSNQIVIKNKDNNGYDNCYDDLVSEGESAYIYFTFGNISSVPSPDPFYIGIYFDGEYVDELYFEGWEIPPNGGIQWVFEIDNQLAGQHTVRIVLDHQNDIVESNENDNEGSRTYTVLGAGAAYESFEFLMNRYFITKNDGSFIAGPLSYSDNSLELNNFGSLSILSIDEHNISFELSTDKDGSKTVINATKSSEEQSTDMTSLLTPITWKLVATDCPGVEINGKWTFAASGTYWFELDDGTIYQKSWKYANETTINYGPYNSACPYTANIVSISNNELNIVDEVPYFYDFVPY